VQTAATGQIPRYTERILVSYKMLNVAITEILTFRQAPSGHGAVRARWKHRIINTDWSDVLVVHKRSAEFNQGEVVALIVFGIILIRDVVRMCHYPLYLRASYGQLIYLDIVTSHRHLNFLWAPHLIRMGIDVIRVPGRTPTHTQNNDDSLMMAILFLSLSKVFSSRMSSNHSGVVEIDEFAVLSQYAKAQDMSGIMAWSLFPYFHFPLFIDMYQVPVHGD